MIINLTRPSFLLVTGQIQQLLAGSDLFIMGSMPVEGVPGVVLEAGVQSLPTVAVKAGGVRSGDRWRNRPVTFKPPCRSICSSHFLPSYNKQLFEKKWEPMLKNSLSNIIAYGNAWMLLKFYTKTYWTKKINTGSIH